MSIAVIIVTRNNPILFGHAISKYQAHPPGIDCDFHIIDAESDDPRQLELLRKQTLGPVRTQPNDRVEVNFDQAYRELPRYDYYFFAHDDNVPIKDNWLQPFIARMDWNYCEASAPDQYRNLPIGRVGALAHFWRGYYHVKGHPVRCEFLKPCVELLTGEPAPAQFKYADGDRILISRECLEATDGLVTVKSLTPNLPDLSEIFDTFLHYDDEGMYPQAKYPPRGYWNRLTLLSEFMNSILPLMRGFRTVGVEGDGYLEAIHGEAIPWGHNYIAHYGAPNALKSLSLCFGTNIQTVKKRLNDPILLAKTYAFFRKFYKETRS
jgi:hypothetical protein